MTLIAQGETGATRTVPGQTDQNREGAMRKNVWLVLGLGFALVSGRAALADVWDVQTQNDNTVATENELVHGSDQLHDLGALPGPAADQDWYRISQKPFSSYEIVAEAPSGDIGTTLVVNRTDATGSVLQSSVAVGVGYSRSLRWINATSSAVDTERIAVQSGSCTTNCGADDVYRLRAYETTYAVPRFNNSGTQVTVLLLQNPTNYTINRTVYFWNPSGGPAGTAPIPALGPKQLIVLNTSGVAPGASGAVTVAHDGRYGDLSGKTVALEPATGFRFDGRMIARVPCVAELDGSHSSAGRRLLPGPPPVFRFPTKDRRLTDHC